MLLHLNLHNWLEKARRDSSGAEYAVDCMGKERYYDFPNRNLNVKLHLAKRLLVPTKCYTVVVHCASAVEP